MSNHSELHNLNNEVESLLNNKDFNNPKIHANLRKAKVHLSEPRLPSIASPISSISRKPTSQKQV